MPAPTQLTPRERERLAGILARLASPHDGERAAAGLLASAFMARHGLSWTDLTITQYDAVAPVSAPPEAPPRERRHNPVRPWRGYCRRHKRDPGAALSCMA